eukprot:g5421.t1
MESRVVGLTGGIASGKSTVLGFFESAARDIEGVARVEIVDADRLGHACYVKGHPCLADVVEAFGEIILQDGELDRRALGSIVFSDPAQLQRLNGIVWPHIKNAIEEKIATFRAGVAQDDAKGMKLIVVEAAVMIEAGWCDVFDEVWVVHAPESTRLRRLMDRNALSEDEARRRLAAQMPDSERMAHSHVQVANPGTVEQLRQNWEIAMSQLLSSSVDAGPRNNDVGENKL